MEQNLDSVGLWGREKPEKPLGAKQRTNNKTRSTNGVDAAGFERDQYYWKASALTPLRHWPCSPESSRYAHLPRAIKTHTICVLCIYQNDSFLTRSVFLTVSCLSCYTCTSNVSWADCNSKMTKTGCPSGTPNCAKSLNTCITAGGVKKQIFYKRCGTQGKECQPKNGPSACSKFVPVFGFGSQNMCCSGNNCNSGPQYKVSSALMGASILLVFLSYHSCFTF